MSIETLIKIKCDACSAHHKNHSESYCTINYKNTDIHVCLDCIPNIDKEFIKEQIPKPLFADSFYITVPGYNKGL